MILVYREAIIAQNMGMNNISVGRKVFTSVMLIEGIMNTQT